MIAKLCTKVTEVSAKVKIKINSSNKILKINILKILEKGRARVSNKIK